MAINRLKTIPGMALIIALGWPLTSAMAWQGFLVLFSPPPAGRPVSGEHITEIKTMPVDPCALASHRNVQIVDDAGRTCGIDTLRIVELRVETDAFNFIGHAFIATPNRSIGFRTDRRDFGLMDYLLPTSAPCPGYVRDDSDSPCNFVRRYRVGTQTLRKLERSIDAHSNDAYQIGDWNGGRNCATWAADRLREAGLTPPPGDCPNKMAWHMRQMGSDRPVRGGTPGVVSMIAGTVNDAGKVRK